MKIYDCIIIGGGIAGITASIYLKNANKDILLIEKSTYGGILNKISKIENYPSYKTIAGPELAYNLYEQIKYNKIETLEDTVISLDIENNLNKVNLKNKSLYAKYLIIATGKEARKLNLENEDNLLGHGVSYCALCDGPFYKDKDVCVIGSGESALQESLYLANICRSVTIINKYSYFKCKESVLKQVLKKDNISISYDSITKSLNSSKNHLKSITYQKNDQEFTKEVSGVFIYIGSTPNIISLENLELDGKYLKVDNNMKTSIDTIYAVGDVIKKDIYQLINAANEGMIAATSIIKKINKDQKE